MPLNSPSTDAITDQALRRAVYFTTLSTLLLPPFVGGSLMGLIGFYPMPEFYLVFGSYSTPYVAFWLVLGLLFARHSAAYLTNPARLEDEASQRRLSQVLRPFPVYLFLFLTLYSIGGATSANLSLQSLGIAEYNLRDHLFTYVGLLPVVLITVFPIFFHFSDLLGRYLGPRGFHQIVTPMWSKLVMLGLVTPVLIDSVLIAYFVKRTGEFDIELFSMWFALMLLAALGTYLALASFRQGLRPLQGFIGRQLIADTQEQLMPQSVDELGSLTGELAGLLRERQQISEMLKKEGDFVDAVVDNAGALVVVLDTEGRITRFNRACEDFSGYDFKDVRGRFVWDFLLPEDEAAKVQSEAFAAALQNPQPGARHYTNRWLTRDGSPRTIEWTNTLLLDEQGQPEHMVSIGNDVTERLQTLAALEQSQRQLRSLNESLEARVAERTTALENSNRELEAYSYSIAHDLRSPLRSIVGFSQILLMDARDKLDEEEISHLERIVNSGKHMAQLIDDILAMGRVSRQQLQCQSLDLSAMAREVVQELQQTEPEREVTVHIQDGLGSTGDPQLLHLLLLNLLGNAWKYTRHQDHALIEFAQLPGADETVFLVRDNGIGFNPEHAGKLFQPFHRLHRNDEFEGTGVGLATVQRILRRHGGRIWAEAQPDAGATFFFSLPPAHSCCKEQ